MIGRALSTIPVLLELPVQRNMNLSFLPELTDQSSTDVAGFCGKADSAGSNSRDFIGKSIAPHFVLYPLFRQA